MALPRLASLSFVHQVALDAGQVPFDLLVLILDETFIHEEKKRSKLLESWDSKTNGMVSALCSLGDFEGKWLQETHTAVAKSAFAKRLAFLGSGKKTDLPAARARQLGIKISELIKSFHGKKIAFISVSSFLESSFLLGQCALGVQMGLYQYPNSNLSEESKKELENPAELTIVTELNDFPAELAKIKILQDSLLFCRLLQDGPPNIVNPKYVSSHFLEEAQKYGIQTQIFGAEKLRSMGFGSMMAVAGASANEPQFVVAEYKPQKFTKTLTFVGKGLTMDTGGYSMKIPSGHQEGMKFDMSGAAISLSSLLAIARLQLPVHVYAIGALCENMVDAHAYRVGDVLTSYSGKTIQVLNTDAEGRLVLCDALHYAVQNLKSDCIVEFSTLTGAIVSALGHVGAGLFSTNQSLEAAVLEASEKTGERVFAFPVWEEVAEVMKSNIADLRNISPNRLCAGSMSAAAFLNEFVGSTPYAHIDIAGVAYGCLSTGYTKKGSSGYGVQLAIEIAKQFSH